MTDRIDDVTATIREIAETEVVARFRTLQAGDIDEKNPGDFVTIADKECERVLGAELRTIVDAPVVGEEATELDPSLPDLIDDVPACWIVDPVDGTANFVDGSPNFAVMVALVEHGTTTAGWIWLPMHDRMLVAARGTGLYENGERVRRAADAPTRPGIIKQKYLPAELRGPVGEVAAGLDTTNDFRCAGVEYTAVATGEIDYLFYWRIKPWDHAPGMLLAAEAGLTAARLDASPYRPGDRSPGVLAAGTPRWETIGSALRRATDKTA